MNSASQACARQLFLLACRVCTTALPGLGTGSTTTARLPCPCPPHLLLKATLAKHRHSTQPIRHVLQFTVHAQTRRLQLHDYHAAALRRRSTRPAAPADRDSPRERPSKRRARNPSSSTSKARATASAPAPRARSQACAPSTRAGRPCGDRRQRHRQRPSSPRLRWRQSRPSTSWY